jgi:hypothetical protein
VVSPLARRGDAHRHAFEQPMPRPFAHCDRLDASERHRGTHARQQTEAHLDVLAHAREREAVQSDEGPSHRERADEDEHAEDGGRHQQ